MVVHPFFTGTTYHLQPKHAWAIGVVSWVMAILCAAPMLSPTRNSPTEMWEIQRRQCLCQVPRNEGQPEAFRTYSLILAGLGSFLPLLLTPMANSVLGPVVPGLDHSPEAACGSAGGQWCGSPCLLLCARMPRCAGWLTAPASPIRRRLSRSWGPSLADNTHPCTPGRMHAPLALHGYGTQPVQPPMSLRL